MYRRARVAITVAFPLDPSGRPKAWTVPAIHVGHARTMLLGSLAAEHYGCPFHIRLDGIYQYAKPDGTVALLDRGDLILPVVSCLSGLRIPYDAMYWVPQEPSSLSSVPQALAERPSWRILDTHLAQVLDDAIDYAPSLIVRGVEFRPDIDPSTAGVVHLSQFVADEEAVFRAVGQEKHELTIPMVHCYRGKMSKSELSAIPWEVLRMVSPDSAKEFLLATVSDPVSPLDALGRPLDIGNLDLTPYQWKWSDWTAFVRQAC